MTSSATALSRRSLFRCTAGAGLALVASPLPLRASPLKKINFQLDWIAYGRHVPYYLARELGFYASAGLDVNIEQGTGAIPGFRYLAADRAQFVFQDIGSMLAVRNRDGLKMKAVSCVYQKAPHTAFFIEDRGIKAPADLAGKKVAYSPGNSPKVMFPAFAAAQNIPDTISWLAADPNSLNSLLLTHQADSILTYIFTKPILQKSARGGDKIGSYLYSENGADFYGNGIIAMEAYIESNPDVVRGFLEATRKGFEQTWADPKRAVEVMMKYQPQLDPAVALEEIDLLSKLCVSADSTKLGFGIITRDKMKTTSELVSKYMGVQSTGPIDEAFTNAFRI